MVLLEGCTNLDWFITFKINIRSLLSLQEKIKLFLACNPTNLNLDIQLVVLCVIHSKKFLQRNYFSAAACETLLYSELLQTQLNKHASNAHIQLLTDIKSCLRRHSF